MWASPSRTGMITLTSVGGGTDLGVADTRITISELRASRHPDRPRRAAARTSLRADAVRARLVGALWGGSPARPAVPHRRPPGRCGVRTGEHGRHRLPARVVG